MSLWCTKSIQQSLTVPEEINSVMTLCLHPLCSYTPAQQKNILSKTKYSPASLWGSLSLLFCFPAFPQAEIGKSRLCYYHQCLNGSHPQTVHQSDPVCAPVALQWMRGLLGPDLNKNNICIINSGLLLQIYKDQHLSIIQQWFFIFLV